MGTDFNDRRTLRLLPTSNLLEYIVIVFFDQHLQENTGNEIISGATKQFEKLTLAFLTSRIIPDHVAHISFSQSMIPCRLIDHM